ncbi:MAG: hypothetical protein NZ518_04515 [Dehalococcoidia bacterium]|nr:hypothetical protein [Dehalococcoidia bacterium]
MPTQNPYPDEPTSHDLSQTRRAEPAELVDQLGPDETRKLIGEAVEKFADASRQESWARRRERTLRLARILEQRLDYDIERFVRPSSH